MSGPLILLCVGLVFLIWAGVLGFQWYTVIQLQKEIYPQYRKDSLLKPAVQEEDFARVFLLCEGPRLSTYIFAGALAAPFLIVICLRIFNLVWDFIWDRTGQLGWFDVGELPHSLMTVFLYVAILFAIAWFSMRRYHLTAPGSLKAEMRRLNGD